MKTNHMLGSWEIGDRIGFGRWGGYRQITSADCLRVGGQERKVFALVDPEHAPLVAAAPDMLAALQNTCDALDFCISQWPDTDPLKRKLIVTHDAGRKAIAKAKPVTVNEAIRSMATKAEGRS